MATTPKPIPKFRPYLSMGELNAILRCIELERRSGTNDDPILDSAEASLLKTKTLAELKLSPAAYIATPRPTIADRLGFPSASDMVATKAPPNFDEMLAMLNTPATGEIK